MLLHVKDAIQTTRALHLEWVAEAQAAPSQYPQNPNPKFKFGACFWGTLGESLGLVSNGIDNILRGGGIISCPRPR